MSSNTPKPWILYSVSCYPSPVPENDNIVYRPIVKDSTPVLLFKKVSPWKDHMIFIVPAECISVDACNDCKYYYILNLNSCS